MLGAEQAWPFVTGRYRPILLKKSAIVFAAEKHASVIKIAAFG